MPSQFLIDLLIYLNNHLRFQTLKQGGWKNIVIPLLHRTELSFEYKGMFEILNYTFKPKGLDS